MKLQKNWLTNMELNMFRNRLVKVLRRFIIIFCLMCYIPTKCLAADELTPKITNIKQGQSSPWDGVLLNVPAAAKIFAEKDYSLEECKLQITFEIEKEKQKIQEQLDKEILSRKYSDERYVQIIQLKEKELIDLRNIHIDEKPDYSIWWYSGGVVTGIALTVAITFAVINYEK